MAEPIKMTRNQSALRLLSATMVRGAKSSPANPPNILGRATLIRM